MTDLQHFLSGSKFKLIWSHVRVEDQSTITGFHLVNGWGKERYLYFAARYSRPFDRFRIMSDGKEVKYDSYQSYRFRSSREAAGTNLQFLAEYKTTADEAILVKAAVSPVSAANALQNLDCRDPAPGLGFRADRPADPRAMEPGARAASKSTPRRARRRPSTRRCTTSAWRPACTRTSTENIGDWTRTSTAPRASGITRSSRCGTPFARRIRSSP